MRVVAPGVAVVMSGGCTGQRGGALAHAQSGLGTGGTGCPRSWSWQESGPSVGMGAEVVVVELPRQRKVVGAIGGTLGRGWPGPRLSIGHTVSGGRGTTPRARSQEKPQAQPCPPPGLFPVLGPWPAVPVLPALPHPPLQEGLPRAPLHRHHVTARKPRPSSQSTSPAAGPGPPPPPRPLVTVSVSLLMAGQAGSPHPTPGFPLPSYTRAGHQHMLPTRMQKPRPERETQA